MLKAYILRPDGTTSRCTDRATLEEAYNDKGTMFWLDIGQLDDEEIEILLEVFKFHELAVEDCVTYSQRPKIEHYEHIGDGLGQGYFYMVIHGPDLQTVKSNVRTKEMDIFMSERYLVTIHDEHMKSIDEVMNRAETDPRVIFANGIDGLLYQILDRLTDHYMPIMDYIEDTIDELEDAAAEGNRPSLLERLTKLKRELLNLRRIVGPQREVVAQLSRGDVAFIQDKNRIYFRDVLDHLVRTVEMLEIYRDLVQGARDIYLSSISLHLNQIMKTLTIISVVCLPLTILTSFFGMNFHVDWWLEWWMFLIALCVMVGTVTSLLYWFRRNNWI
jgi:magnesium transporter